MPSKAIELASFDLYKKVLIPGDPSNGIGGFLTSVAGAMAGQSLHLGALTQPPSKELQAKQQLVRLHISQGGMSCTLLLDRASSLQRPPGGGEEIHAILFGSILLR